MAISEERCSIFRSAWTRSGTGIACSSSGCGVARFRARGGGRLHRLVGTARPSRFRNPSRDPADRRHGRCGGRGAAVRLRPMAPGGRGSAEAGALLARLPGGLRQPLIVACGHSLGANAMGKFARLLGQSGLEVSLAVYIDAFSAGKSQVPANVNCAHQFLSTGPACSKVSRWRGQSGLVAVEPGRTTLLGSYLLKPRGKPYRGQTEAIPPPVFRTTLPAGPRRARAGIHLRLGPHPIAVVGGRGGRRCASH